MTLGIHSSRGAERYTREREIEPVRRAFGGIDFDPCSCVQAQKKILAVGTLNLRERGEDGLALPWTDPGNLRRPRSAWINPPSTKAGHRDASGERHHEPAVWWARTLRAIRDGEIDRFAFLFFTLESLRHCALYDRIPHPDDAPFRRLWLYERPIFDDEDGTPVKNAEGGKGSPAHAAVIVFGGDLSAVRWEELSEIGRLSQ